MKKSPPRPLDGKPARTPASTKTPPSTAPLISRLQTKPGHTFLVLHAPDPLFALFDPIPDDVRIVTTPQPGQQYDGVLLFAINHAAINADAPTAIAALKPGGLLWFAYPKQSGAIATDINRDTGWNALTDAGWQGVRQIAIDATWSALRFRPASEIKPRK